MTAKSTTAKKFYYSVSEHRQGDYHHLTVKVSRKPESVPDYYPFWDAIQFTYQSNRSESPARWYGGTLEIDGGSNLDKYQEAVKLARRVCPNGNLDDLPAILATLDKIADYVVYDPRTSTAVTALYPPEYHCYRDDYESAGYSSCHCNALARDEDDAKRAIMRRFAEHYSHTEEFEKWILAGKPVMPVWRYSSTEPDYRTIAERIDRTPAEECAYLREWAENKARREAYQEAYATSN